MTKRPVSRISEGAIQNPKGIDPSLRAAIRLMSWFVDEDVWSQGQCQSKDDATCSYDGEGGLSSANHASLLIDNGIFGSMLASMHISYHGYHA